MKLDYDVIADLIEYLDQHAAEQPSLELLARRAGVSPTHLQRVFRRWVGVSPKQFCQVAMAADASALLARGRSVLDTTYDLGLSGPSRLHDLTLSIEALTPGEIRAKGAGVALHYGSGPSPFGRAFVAWSQRGVVSMHFERTQSDPTDEFVSALGSRWPLAKLQQDEAGAIQLLGDIFGGGKRPVTLLVKGTNLQVKVWQALLNIPEGAALSYADVAQLVGHPKAVRPVASAVARNEIAYLIPCHRVVRKTGLYGKFRWGAARKRILLAYEAFADTAHTT